MSKTLLLVNTLTAIDSRIYGNHIEFMMASKAAFPEDTFVLFTPERLSVDNARNTAAVYAMQMGCDYLMFIDDDVLVPIDTYAKLKSADKDVIAGLTYIRNYPYNPMVFSEKSSSDASVSLEFWEPPRDGEVHECFAVGFSCCLIKVDVLSQLSMPYFFTGPNQTEDVFFCCKAKEELMPTPSVFVHTGVLTGHLQRPMAVHPNDVEKWRAFFKPEAKETSSGDRGKEYLEAQFKGPK